MQNVTKCRQLQLLVILLLSLSSYAVFASSSSEVRSGDKVVLVKPMNDGVTYFVQTPGGLEIWKDRDLYHFAAYQETCTVVESYGSEVLLYVPIMNAKYWFSVKKTRLEMQ